MTKLVKCPICGQTKRIDHSRTRSFNCCGIRLPLEGHIIYEGVKRPRKVVEKPEEDKFVIGGKSFSEKEIRELIKEILREEENERLVIV